MKKQLYRIWNPIKDAFDPDIWMYQSGQLDHDSMLGSDLQNCIVQYYTWQDDFSTSPSRPIFEGDILSWDGPHDSEFKGEVKFNLYDLRYECIAIHNDTRPHYNLLTCVGVKVIGNIFENPELLK